MGFLRATEDFLRCPEMPPPSPLLQLGREDDDEDVESEALEAIFAVAAG
jgi:hypothetical protein